MSDPKAPTESFRASSTRPLFFPCSCSLLIRRHCTPWNHDLSNVWAELTVVQCELDFGQIARDAPHEFIIVGLFGRSKTPKPQRKPTPPPRGVVHFEMIVKPTRLELIDAPMTT